MIDEQVQIKELYDLKHRNDKELHTGYDYEDNLMEKTLSRTMFKNPMLSEFLTNNLQNLCVWMIESVLPIRNFWCWSVSKYYNRHSN
jgi:hypothetical protein